MTLGVAFVAVALVLCLAALLGIYEIARRALNSTAGRERDGLAPGSRAPTWSVPDIDDVVRSSPSPPVWQLLVFGDHSLRQFPGVLEAIQELEAESDLQILVLAREHSRDVLWTLRVLGINVPLLAVPPSLYHRYNVQVMPFVIFVDPNGRVQASSLVNHRWQVLKLSRFVRLAGSPQFGRQGR